MKSDTIQKALELLYGSKSSVVMKYFVSGEFRFLYFIIATKGAACRELYVWCFDFSVHTRATRARHVMSYGCNISTFPFVVG